MGIKIEIPVNVVTFTRNQYNNWLSGKREDCPDRYCKGLPGTKGFGEYLVGNFFAEAGYLWIHHDFDVFGACKPGKYPLAKEILIKYMGREKYESARTLYKAVRGFAKVEQPDLFIYKPDGSEIRFAESKRLDTYDKLRESQVRGLAMFSLLLGCKAEVFEVLDISKKGQYEPKPVIWEF